MKTIKVGTIGYGGAFNMGRQHLNELVRNPGFVATAVCDIDPARVKIAETDFPGIQTYTDLDTMLEKSDVELLVIILPHNVHGEVALKCLKAGRHVVVEKPFAITVDECDAMIAEAKARNLLCSCYHNRHWDSNILTITKHLAKIGRPFRWESYQGGYGKPGDWWRSKKEISGGLIYDWGAHFMEWMLQVMPYEMTEIAGYSANDVWPVTNEDELEAVVRFGANAVVSHQVTQVALEGKPALRIVGTKGTITWDWRNVNLTTVNDIGETVRTTLVNEPGAQLKYYENIHAHLFNGDPLIITPEHARRVIQILDYATRSAEKSETLKAKYV
ncbi:MAG: Gfo/Idh/MocA family oxidoreductase [Verrucomicrobiota bacterium]|nr:Gfo/Idh/MocA family oxidoreductase [Verrucomicrobiota bacterium]